MSGLQLGAMVFLLVLAVLGTIIEDGNMALAGYLGLAALAVLAVTEVIS